MSHYYTNIAPPQRNWLGRAEDWLDARGRGAWIATTVLSLIVFWPLGLALLAYIIWSKRMFKSCGHRHHRNGDTSGRMSHRGFQSTGNTAFDAYKADTLNRLEEEQAAFQDFLRRLRESKDKAQFDAYMEERAQAAKPAPEAGAY